MTTARATLRELRLLNQNIKTLISLNISEKVIWCETNEALLIMGRKNPRDLKKLVEQGVLTREKFGKSFKYKKSECHKIAMSNV